MHDLNIMMLKVSKLIPVNKKNPVWNEYILLLTFTPKTKMHESSTCSLAETITQISKNSYVFMCLQVGTNGVISFQEGFSHHLPNPFPSELTFISSAFILAPFWTDIDPSVYGSILYQIHDQYNSALLSQVNDFISDYIESAFVGTWMLVVQWTEVVEVGTTAPVSLLYQPVT